MRRRTFLGLTVLTAVAPVLTEKVFCGVDWSTEHSRSFAIVMKNDVCVRIVEIDRPSREMTIKLIGVTTGRFSSAGPNLSNIPRVG